MDDGYWTALLLFGVFIIGMITIGQFAEYSINHHGERCCCTNLK